MCSESSFVRFDGIEYFCERRGVTSSFVIFGRQQGVERYYPDMPRPVRLDYPNTFYQDESLLMLSSTYHMVTHQTIHEDRLDSLLTICPGP